LRGRLDHHRRHEGLPSEQPPRRRPRRARLGAGHAHRV